MLAIGMMVYTGKFFLTRTFQEAMRDAGQKFVFRKETLRPRVLEDHWVTFAFPKVHKL